MGITATPGHRAGVNNKRLEAGYELEPGKWDEQNVIHDFGDGWTIVEDKTDHDRCQMAKLTRTCVHSLIYYCFPEHPELVKKREEMKERYKNRSKELGYYVGRYAPVYRLMHLQCPEGKAHVCIVLASAKVCNDPNKRCNYSYLSSRDLGKQPPITIDGEQWVCLETRIGTGHRAPEYGMERICQWWSETCDGEWNQKLYDKQHVSYYEEIRETGYDGAYTFRPHW